MDKKFDFTTFELTVKNNPSLKQRDEFEVVMKIERSLLPKVVGLEAWPKGSHFKVEVEPIESNDFSIAEFAMSDLISKDEEKTKSPSKRLRDVIYLRWDKKTNKSIEFEAYYRQEMEKIINQYKSYLN